MTDPAIHTAFGPASAHRKSRNKQALQLVRGLALDAKAPLIGLVCPLDDVHGISYVVDILDALIGLSVQVVAQGLGDRRYEEFFARAAAASPLSVSFRPESPSSATDSARRLFAGADIFLAPGRESSALPIARRYGAIPITPITPQLRLADSNRTTDFQFDPNVPGSLLNSIHSAIERYRSPKAWNALVQSALLTDPRWNDAAIRYERLYRATLRHTENETPRAGEFEDLNEMRAF